MLQLLRQWVYLIYRREDRRAILLNDVDSTEHNHVLRGHLLLEIEEQLHDCNYILYHDNSTGLKCQEKDVALLERKEFLLLEAIKDSTDRLDAYHNKLSWGGELTQGCTVFVTIPEAASSSRAFIRSIGTIGNLPGMYFGVEILVSSPKIFQQHATLYLL